MSLVVIIEIIINRITHFNYSMACHLIMKMILRNPHEQPEKIMIAGF